MAIRRRTGCLSFGFGSLQAGFELGAAISRAESSAAAKLSAKTTPSCGRGRRRQRDQAERREPARRGAGQTSTAAAIPFAIPEQRREEGEERESWIFV